MMTIKDIERAVAALGGEDLTVTVNGKTPEISILHGDIGDTLEIEEAES